MLRLVSYLAPSQFWFYQIVAEYLGRQLDEEIEIVQSQHDPLLDSALLDDEIDIAFICGLPFIRHHQVFPHQLQAIAAPVLQAPRYSDRPVYFSDIIVNANSNIFKFEELAGKRFCYNDPGSNSGYHLLRDRIFQSGYSRDFFGELIPSGFHQNSIKLVSSGLADFAAIDSTVLEEELRNDPQLSFSLRVIESIGPSPIPPIIAAQRLGNVYIDRLQFALLHPDAQLRSAMDRAQIHRYAPVVSADYLILSTMYTRSKGVL